MSILDKLLCFLFIDPIQLRDKVYAFESVSQTSGSFISRIVAAFFFPAFLTLSWNLCLTFISMILTRVVHGYPTFSSSSALSASLLLSVFTLLSSPILVYILSPYLSILSTVGGLFVRCLLILFSIMYIFCVLGHNLFGCIFLLLCLKSRQIGSFQSCCTQFKLWAKRFLCYEL